MTLIVLGEAGEEFAEPVQYYEAKEVGLGARFRDEAVEAVERIVSNPRVTTVKAKRISPSKLARFPALHRLRNSRREDLDHRGRSWSSAARVLDRPDFITCCWLPLSAAPERIVPH